MALRIVLVALPRLLDDYFAQQDQANLEARTEAMATLVGNQIIMVTTLAGNPLPGAPGAAAASQRRGVSGARADRASSRNLTPSVALADVTVTIAERRPMPRSPVYTLACRWRRTRASPARRARTLVDRDVGVPGAGRVLHRRIPARRPTGS